MAQGFGPVFSQKQWESNAEMSPLLAYEAEPAPELSPFMHSIMSPLFADDSEPAPEMSPFMHSISFGASPMSGLEPSPEMSPTLSPQAFPEIESLPFSSLMFKKEPRFPKHATKDMEGTDVDTWLQWDMLAGMVQQPLQKSNPSDVLFAWDLLAGMVQHPLPKADASDTLFAFDLLEGCIINWESETLALDMLAGMAPQHGWHGFSNGTPLDARPQVPGQVPFGGPYTRLPAQGPVPWEVPDVRAHETCRAILGQVPWGETWATWSTWEMLNGMVPQPLAQANPSDTEFAFEMLTGSVPRPLSKSDPKDMWFAWEMLAGSAFTEKPKMKFAPPPRNDGVLFDSTWDLLAEAAFIHQIGGRLPPGSVWT